MKPGPAWFYLHGFASSPASKKAQAFVAWGAAHGVAIEVLDLRAPSLSRLRFSQMVARVRAAIYKLGDRGRVVLIGSSLGGLTACRVAEADPHVVGLFLMAPAFRIIERWRARLGEPAWEQWRVSDALEITDYATREKTFIDYGFADELAALDDVGDGFPDVRVPTCIVHGTRDDVVDIGLSRSWASARPHVRLVEVDDGHELAASVPQVLSEASAFLAPFGARSTQS